ncbi:hypothetical protein, partial [Rothia mucilaginosa]|uniref:hypothetical protein n=1 Tax=Rothia mucilaginosa TaxID=43675 RepID=UPI0026F2DD8F
LSLGFEEYAGLAVMRRWFYPAGPAFLRLLQGGYTVLIGRLAGCEWGCCPLLARSFSGYFCRLTR